MPSLKGRGLAVRGQSLGVFIMPMSHDQNFKNLILDYPLQALAFSAPEEAKALPPDVVIRSVREELPKDRLGDRFFELDVPLLAEWPDGRREALLFVVEEQTDPARFSIRKLASYCLAIGEFYDTDRVVPVVIFLRSGASIARQFRMGSDQQCYLDFHYIACVLPEIPVEDHLNSQNIVARLNLVNMRLRKGQRVHAYGHAVRGLMTLESSWERQQKYIDFVEAYGALDEEERRRYRELYVTEDAQMMQWSERLLDQGEQRGVQKGLQQGLRQGQLGLLADLLAERFGVLDEAVQARLEQADEETLKRWGRNLLSARSMDEVFRAQ